MRKIAFSPIAVQLTTAVQRERENPATRTTVSDTSAPFSCSACAGKQLHRHEPRSGTAPVTFILPPAQRTSCRKHAETEEKRARVLRIFRHTENVGLITLKISMYVHFLPYIPYKCTLTDIYYPLMEDSTKTSVISYSLLWSSEFPVNSYRKCWISHFSYIWEVLCSIWKQNVWKISF